MTGHTQSADFPAVTGPGYDTSYNGLGDAFAMKLTSTVVQPLIYDLFLPLVTGRQ